MNRHWIPAFAGMTSLILLPWIPLLAEEIQLTDVRLTHTTGHVVITLGGVSGSPLMSAQMPLEEGDRIRTGAGSWADISFDEGTLVRVGPQSSLLLKRIRAKATGLFLSKGLVLCRVQYEKNEGQQFTVATPMAVATVQGTEFAMEQQGARAIIGVLNEGHVSVKSPGFKKNVVMHFNQETLVQKGAPPKDAQVLTKLYPHKVIMAEMRDRIKQLRRHETELAPQQRALMRTGWIKTHEASPKPKPATPPRLRRTPH